MQQRPSLSAEHVARLEAALRRHLLLIRKQLADRERDTADLHFQIAGQLRVLLCDPKLPILLTYAEHKQLPLRIWGPNPAGFRGPQSGFGFEFNALLASAQPVADGYEMSIEEYLDTAIGGMTVRKQGDDGPPRSVWYTPRQLIKWVANKEGVAHLELDPHASLTAVQTGIVVSGTVTVERGSEQVLSFGATDQFTVRSALLQIAVWTVQATDLALAAPTPAPSTPGSAS